MDKLALFAVVFAAVSAASGQVPGKAQSTIAPGAPPHETIATVLGKGVPGDQKAQLSARIVTPLLDQFGKENKIEPAETEVDACQQWLERRMEQLQARQLEWRKELENELSAGNLSETERQQKEARLAQMKKNEEAFLRAKEADKGQKEQIRQGIRQVAQAQVRRWMVFKALFDRYGGRIAFQQAGPEPVEALRDFLKEQEQKGAFQIVDPAEATRFWRYYTDPAVHHFFPEAEGNRVINTPLWRMEKPLGQ